MSDDREEEHRAYQLDGSLFLATHKRALLADQPGLGKTYQTIQGWKYLQCSKVLVLCPSIARYVWLRQSEHFFGRGLNITMPLKEKDRVPTSGSVVLSYDLAIQKDISTGLLSREWDCVVADESHYLNGLTSKRSAVFWEGIVPRSTYVWCLSGTPARNHMGEMWSMLFYFGIIRQDYWDYVESYNHVQDTLYGTKVLGLKKSMVVPLRRLFNTFMLRRTKEDVGMQLPAISYSVVPVEPAPVDFAMWFTEARLQQTSLEALEYKIAEQLRTMDKIIEISGAGESAATALGGLGVKCEQSRKYMGLQKVPMVAKLIEYELENDHYDKIVLFCWHRDVIEFMRILLGKFHPLAIWGGQLITKRDKVIRSFQTDPKSRVVLANIAAAGVAIDLTVASEVGLVEASFTPGENAQAVMRVYRDGQKRPVRCRLFSVYGSVDEKIAHINRRKIKDLVSIFHEGDGNSAVSDPFES